MATRSKQRTPPPFDPKPWERLAATHKVLSEPNRLIVLRMIADEPDLTVSDVKARHPLKLSQPTMSHHIRVLDVAGLVTKEKRKVHVHLTVTDFGRRLLELDLT